MVAVGWLLHMSEYINAVVLIEKVTKCGQVGVAGRSRRGQFLILNSI